MKKLFLDTNILIDFLSDRQPFSFHATDIFNLSINQSVQLFTSTHSFATTHFVLKKYLSPKELQPTLEKLLKHMTLLPVTEKDITTALMSKHPDFEDAVQMCTALEANMDFIISRNIKDFKHSPVPTHTCAQFLQRSNHSST